ncbi:hypothetical protein AB0D37_07275 [Streptomyces sp. NPDC048384]|uniref:hypothetical protein n=1 Tax=Streptomyces sp. NPDC048384 TaxID=3155487 RepID=UPI003440126A
MRAALLVAGVTLLAVGLYIIVFGESSGGAPKESPRVPAASIGPDGAEPAWTHVCLGTDDEPAGCKDI